MSVKKQYRDLTPIEKRSLYKDLLLNDGADQEIAEDCSRHPKDHHIDMIIKTVFDISDDTLIPC